MAGLELEALVPVLISVPITILLELFMVMIVKGGGIGLILRGVCGLSPTAAALTFVLIFIHKKPPNYMRDSMELLRTRIPIIGAIGSPCGVSFNTSPSKRSVLHPLLRAKQELKES